MIDKMISLRKIWSNNPECSFIRSLYESAFPEDERRDFDEWMYLLENQEEFEVFAIYDENEAVGFITVWGWDSWRYVEHFAIDNSRRGGGIGANAFEQLLNMDKRPLILEVEPPTDEISKRRISFYERQGMKIHEDYEYIQPAYSKDKKALPMRLMTYDVPEGTDLSEPVRLMYRDVYKINQA